MADQREYINYKLASERHKEIINLLDINGTLRVAELSKNFGVTEETIRRDLERLEKKGLLKRVHGGAIKTQKAGFEIPVLERQSINMADKQAIGMNAASLVHEGDVIALDASTTCLQMAKHLSQKNITVITNALAIAIELGYKEDISVIMTGGYLRKESMSLVGFSGEKAVQGYHVDKCFISCSGFDLNWGVSESHEMQAQMKKQLISISDHVYLLADHSKFGNKSLVQLLRLDEIEALITDNKIAVNDIRKINEKGISTIVVDSYHNHENGGVSQN